MEPARRFFGALVIPRRVSTEPPATTPVLPNLTIPREAIHNKITPIFDNHYKMVFPFESPVPTYLITAIAPKTLKIGIWSFPGFDIAVHIPSKTMDIHFEASQCLTIFKPTNELILYPIEALVFILKILKLPLSDVKVIKVKDHLHLAWGTLKFTDDILTVKCFSIEFMHHETKHHFYFDTKLRFFKNAAEEMVYLRPPLIQEKDETKTLRYASEQLKMDISALKITNIVPAYDGPDTGYKLIINDGLLEIFLSCLPDYNKVPWNEPPNIPTEEDYQACLQYAASQLNTNISLLKITQRIRTYDHCEVIINDGLFKVEMTFNHTQDPPWIVPMRRSKRL